MKEFNYKKVVLILTVLLIIQIIVYAITNAVVSSKTEDKKAAREKIKGNLWNIWKALLVPAAVGFVLACLLVVICEIFDRKPWRQQIVRRRKSIVGCPTRTYPKCP